MSDDYPIRYEDRILAVGATGTGKSTLVLRLFFAAAPPRLVIDPADSDLTDVEGAVTARTVADLEAAHEADTLRFVPRAPDRPEEYDDVYRWAFHRRFPGLVWLDEAGLAAPAQGCPRWITAYLVQGRKRGLGHIACHTRPREISRNLIAQAQHVLLWSLPNPDDRRAVAQQIGVAEHELDSALRGLPPYGFLWWQLRTGDLVECPPLDAATGPQPVEGHTTS